MDVNNEYYDKAESILLDYTGSFKWEQIKYLKWTSAEVQELIVIALLKHDKSHKINQNN